MRGFLTQIAAGFALALTGIAPTVSAQEAAGGWSLAIHGGAGTIARENMSAEEDAAYRASLQAALDAGAKVLAEGGEALDAVEAVILLLEDDPRFNAGRGAVFTWEGGHELDASIMDGRDRDAGAVAGVTTVRHPISLARKVMTDSPHVMLAGKGAETFAAEHDLELVPADWFGTDFRREALERMKARELSALDVDAKFGTVGAVALDRNGNLAAGTSTGGMTGKRWNRIGDAPVIGAGTYADNRSCAVSATGWGEYFIRVGVAHEICTRLRIEGELLKDAEAQSAAASGATHFISNTFRLRQAIVDEVLAEVAELGGDGGVIVATPDGATIFSFNTPGMYRARANSLGLQEVAIYGDE
ncbi:isoaspartyl peptidase/L-asparaginase family protein [Qipengyuania huizhouensis]|uniref:isoaspartyl peptidase/L-asparaginase family protein n=1 Tax=Qipengyuania huizhouensis TaxID=2867245 RepID=UPI001C887AD0|nr:isoaspartyl peptidase/L-asparaginase [Qipengyuania huizhouensis]MBX7459819.1 isoaspartyl peptidase/L-asparaginase [Qipengyuania huizhouensis]